MARKNNFALVQIVNVRPRYVASNSCFLFKQCSTHVAHAKSHAVSASSDYLQNMQ